ncbi:MAG: ThuA domain-containing protein, partial [Pseudomonadota bacterium]
MKWLLVTLALALASCAPSNAQTDAAGLTHEATPPDITEFMPQPAVLVFSKTRDWRHNEGIAGADRFFAEFTSENGMGLFTTENGAVFNPEQLARFDLVVFNNMTGDALSPTQERAFQSWLERGGALIALHGSGDNSHGDWSWYDDQVIGPQFVGHPADPQFQDARVVNLASAHPIMDGIPAEWIHNDEWYSFDRADVGNAVPLLGLDEDSYSPQNLLYGDREDLRMGGGPEGHPIAWARRLGEGRTVYSAIGHNHTSYD